jgi:hypothetical protein
MKIKWLLCRKFCKENVFILFTTLTEREMFHIHNVELKDVCENYETCGNEQGS